jgi:curved DNA-binding protein
MKKDYYDILWVTKWTSEVEIKKAYKKLAMQWHPDRHQGDKKAEAKFKEISEAYQTLSDTQKRKQYDTFGTADFSGMGWGSAWWWFSGFDIGDIFGNMGWGRSSQSFEFDLGDILSGLWGQQRGTRSRYSQPIHEDLDITQTIEIPLWDILLGTKLSLESGGSSFRVTIPACTKPGTRLKVTGKGKKSGRKVGNLYLKIEALMPKKLTPEQERMIELWRS